MKFIQTFASQPATFWLSVIATVISICSFIIGVKNSRKNQRLDTLQRRNQLLLKLSELDSKISELRIFSAKIFIKTNNLRASDKPKNDSWEDHIALLEDIQKGMEQAASKYEDLSKSLRLTCTKFTSRTDPVQIEDFMPEIQDALTSIEKLSSMYMEGLHKSEANELLIESTERIQAKIAVGKEDVIRMERQLDNSFNHNK